MSPEAFSSDRHRWIALYVLCTGVLMIVLDVTVVNVALPSIQEDLGFSQSSLAWVVNAYLIAFGGFLMLAGRLGDLVSRRGVFLVGLAIFTLASIACGVSQSQEMLVVSRFIQGLGGAMSSAVVLGMIVTMFPEPRDQAKAIGVYGFVASAGGSIGLLVGGLLTDAINWHWVFFVNVPVGIATAIFAVRLLDHDKGLGLKQGADALGAVLITAALMLLVYTIVEPAAKEGWGAGKTLGFLAASLALLAAFVVRESTAKTPLIPLNIFRSRTTAGANFIQLVSVPAMFGIFFLGALYCERILHYDPLQIGLAFLPGSLIMGIMSLRYTERFIHRFGARRVVITGFVFVLGAVLLFSRAPVDATYAIDLLPVMALFGFGAGLAFPALVTLAMAGVEPQEAGLASGLVNTTAQVGGALGLAVLATVATSRTDTLTAAGRSAAEAINGGYHLAFLIGAGLLVVALLVATFVLRSVPAPQHAAGPHGEPAASEA
jgi:EmrB/QacA subfamily drug resistance transporter